LHERDQQAGTTAKTTSGSVSIALLEQALDQQSLLWDQGECRPVEDFLKIAPALADDRSAVLDLLYHEVVLRQRAGETPLLAEYVGRFPRLETELVDQFQIHRVLQNSRDAESTFEGIDATIDSTRPAASESGGDDPSVPGYEIESVLGRGGMGIVYKAREIRLNRPVALKMILSGRHAGEEARQRFQREAEAVGRLQHPNIVQIYTTGEHQGRPFIALEYVEGGGLNERSRTAPRPARSAAVLAETLARAIHAAHLAGVVHRDLKPANVLLTADGIPKITDFGLAKPLDDTGEQTVSGAILGTPSYMAPEQARGNGKFAGPAADVYSIGAILYELLTGRPPFLGETSLETLQQAIRDDPVPPRRLSPKTPRDLDVICLKCLEKEPQKRYVNALGLAADLRRFLDHQPILARPNSTFERAERWCRRNKAIAASGAVAMIGLVTISLISASYALSTKQYVSQLQASATTLRTAFNDSERNRLESNRRLAENYFVRGRSAVEDGNVSTGILFLAKALQTAPDESTSLQRSIRIQLVSFFSRLHRPRTVLPTVGRLCAVAISADESTVVTATIDGSIDTWSVKTGERIGRAWQAGARPFSIALSANGHILVCALASGATRFFDVVQSQPFGDVIGHDCPANSVALSANGRIAITGYEDGHLQIWDARTGKPAKPLVSHPGRLSLAKLDPQGKIAVTTGAQCTRLWDVESGQSAGPDLPHSVWVRAVAFSPDGKYLVTGSEDRKVRIWDRATATLMKPELEHSLEIRVVVFSSDSRRLFTGAADGSARVWDVATRLPVGDVLAHAAGVSGGEFSPDGSLVITACDDRGARFWDAETGKPIGPPLPHKGEVWHARFLAQGREVLTWGAEDAVRLWQRPPGAEAKTQLQHDAWVSAVAVSRDGERLVTGTANRFALAGKTRVWSMAGERIGREVPHAGPVLSLAFRPDGQ
jgi:eukaryotic-like serine/threonine-protein kinase